jgi:serine/threonine protein kinase/tetratricopeptide (TPR) repeat protein
MIEPVSQMSGMPSTIGRYRIVGRLGKGAMGVVYSARDDQLDREVALKVMMTDLESDPETRARFYREAQITSKLLHRNIITVFDLGEDNGRLYLVMELLRGRTLTDFLKDPESHTVEQKLDLMVQTCEGLSVAHANGVVHRDVKPTNLFVQPDGALKILDFGIARLASSSMTASGLIMGTPDYMSPEQAQGKEVDARSDVFSAGGVFYFMLTGRRPFEAASLPLVLQKVVREEPLPIREHEAPPALAQVIARALSKDPGQRYQRFADMSADLVRFKRSYDTETRRLGASARESFERACRLLSSEREWRGALAVEGSESIGDLEQSVRARYPFFSAAPGQVPPAPVPAGRGRIVSILDDLNSTLAPLSARVDALAAAVAAVEAGEKALDGGDGSGALVHFERAAGSIAEESPRIARGASSARAEISARRELEDRVHSLMAEARMAERRADWPAVADLSAQLLAIQPQMADARMLATRARVALEAAAEVRTRQVQKLLGQAARAIQTAEFADADRLLDEAHGLQTDAEAVKAVRARLTEARVAAAALDAQARRAAQELGAARAMFDAGNRPGAMDRLRAFVRDNPDAAGVTAELGRMTAEAARLAADEQRRRHALEHARQADARWEQGDAEDALRCAELALSFDRGLSGAVRVQSLAKTRLRELAEARTRSAEAGAHVTKARALVAAGRFEKAAREAQRALDLEPDRSEAAHVVAQARRLEAEARAAAERDEAERQREREVEKILKSARRDLRATEYGRAAWAAENALLISPGHAQAEHVLAEARAALTASGSGRPGADDTVQLLPDASPSDPGATVVMHRRSGLKALSGHIGDWASGLRRRLPRRQTR